MKYGIGITTRNRPFVLKTSLAHFAAFPTENVRYVVIDDASENGSENETIVLDFSSSIGEEVVYKRSHTRMGIANAKNACLAELQDCDFVFLFDDDSWPIAENWADQWVQINEANNVGHSMYNVVDPNLLKLNKGYANLICVTSKLGRYKNTMVELTNSFGVVLYFTRECLNVLGGFQPDAPHPYGFEHVQISMRAAQAGFTAGKRYLVPQIASSLIYSVDISYVMLKQEPPIAADWLSGFMSSVAASESGEANKNIHLIESPPINIPLHNPLG